MNSIFSTPTVPVVKSPVGMVLIGSVSLTTLTPSVGTYIVPTTWHTTIGGATILTDVDNTPSDLDPVKMQTSLDTTVHSVNGTVMWTSIPTRILNLK